MWITFIAIFISWIRTNKIAVSKKKKLNNWIKLNRNKKKVNKLCFSFFCGFRVVFIIWLVEPFVKPRNVCDEWTLERDENWTDENADVKLSTRPFVDSVTFARSWKLAANEKKVHFIACFGRNEIKKKLGVCVINNTKVKQTQNHECEVWSDRKSVQIEHYQICCERAGSTRVVSLDKLFFSVPRVCSLLNVILTLTWFSLCIVVVCMQFVKTATILILARQVLLSLLKLFFSHPTSCLLCAVGFLRFLYSWMECGDKCVLKCKWRRKSSKL